MQVDDITVQNRFHSFKLGRTSTSSSDSSLSSKRGSHHRRNSSVSTRHESAEMMGFSLPELPQSSSDDTLEKDSIRRRALWALEGKQEPPPLTMVEIPTPESVTSDFPTRPSFPPGSGNHSFSALSSKRDSFKLLGGASSGKDQLHTLIEEEEEEDGQTTLPSRLDETPLTPTTPHDMAGANIPPVVTARPRPLSLRPLSLKPDSLTGVTSSATNTAPRQGLKTLSLLSNTVPMNNESAMLQPSAASNEPVTISTKKPVLNLHITPDTSFNQITPITPLSDDDNPRAPLRRSSISYKTSSDTNAAGLPTPAMTPTHSERRYSGSVSGSVSRRSSVSSFADSVYGMDDEGSASSHKHPPGRGRGLSASEQHFLFKSHNALLARITDLERALSIRRSSTSSFPISPSPDSRPTSVISDISSSGDGPSDEMLRLVADLKTERDDLKRDIDLWRVRVGDLEKQISVIGKRLESERKEAWVARSQLSLVEAERDVFRRDAEYKDEKLRELLTSKKELEESQVKIRLDLERANSENNSLQLELKRLSAEYEKLKAAVPETPTPLSFKSTFEANQKLFFEGVRSSVDGSEQLDQSDDEDGLAGYEDEDDDDMSYHGSCSSFDSILDEQISRPRDSQSLTILEPATVSNESNERPTHRSRASLSKTWTFPLGAQTTAFKESDSVDKFFDCFDDKDEGGNSQSHIYSYEKSKGLFASGFRDHEDDIPPFFLPLDVEGSLISSTSSCCSTSVDSSNGLLTVVEEEDEVDDAQVEEEDDTMEGMFGDAGGIKITFTPPEEDRICHDILPHSKPIPIRKPVPSYEDSDEEDSIPFSFPPTPSKQAVPKAVSRSTAPSGIPRAAKSPPTTYTPEYPSKLSSPRFGQPTSPSSAYVTPPKRYGNASFIPQPVTPPRSSKSSPTSPHSTRVTFIRQPQRKINAGGGSERALNGSTFKPQLLNNPDDGILSAPNYGTKSQPACDARSNITTIHPYPTTSFYPSNISHPPTPKSSTFVSRFNLSSLANILPMPWSPRAEDDDCGGTDTTEPSTLSYSSKTTLVSRQAQLKKLQARISMGRMSTGIGSTGCSNCKGDLVHL